MAPQVSTTSKAVYRWLAGTFLVVGALLSAPAAFLGDEVNRGLLYWGLLVLWLGIPPLRGLFLVWRKERAARTNTEPPRRSFSGFVVVLLPMAISGAFLATDPSPAFESIYAVATAFWGWFFVTISWLTIRSTRAALGGDDAAPTAPRIVSALWSLVPGALVIPFAVTGPGSTSYSCTDSDGTTATCYDGPIALLIPGILLLVFGAVVAIFLLKRKPAPEGFARLGLSPAAYVAKAARRGADDLDARIELLAEIDHLRDQKVVDEAEVARLRQEVLEEGEGTDGEMGVTLTAAGSTPVAVATVLRDVSGWPQADVDRLVRAAGSDPVDLARLPGQQARRWKSLLEAVGATVDII